MDLVHVKCTVLKWWVTNNWHDEMTGTDEEVEMPGLKYKSEVGESGWSWSDDIEVQLSD